MNIPDRLVHGVVTLMCMLAAASAAADAAQPAPQPAAESGEAIDYDTARSEFAGAPLIGGNSDIGFQFGLVLTATGFGAGVRPHRWNADLVLAGSIKSTRRGVEIAQQSYLAQFDLPTLVPGRVRFTITGSFQRTVDYGYFSQDEAQVVTMGSTHRYHQFDQREALLRTLTRVYIERPYSLLFGLNLRYVDPQAYAGSALAEDAAAGEVRGLRPLGFGSLSFGVAYDTRDNEVFPRRGMHHQLGIKGNYAVPLSAAIGYAAFGAVFTGYLPLAGPLGLAARALLDAQAGHVPFYDLSLGGTFITEELPGGPEGIRGVPIGRYRGLIKLAMNLELRALYWSFKLLGGSFRLGSNVFFDLGAALRDYTAAGGGSGGPRWGAGAGMYLQWGQAAVFRAEVAYSADARAKGGMPVAIYVAEGVMF